MSNCVELTWIRGIPRAHRLDFDQNLQIQSLLDSFLLIFFLSKTCFEFEMNDIEWKQNIKKISCSNNLDLLTFRSRRGLVNANKIVPFPAKNFRSPFGKHWTFDRNRKMDTIWSPNCVQRISCPKCSIATNWMNFDIHWVFSSFKHSMDSFFCAEQDDGVKKSTFWIFLSQKCR